MTVSNTTSGAPSLPGRAGGFSTVPVTVEAPIDASALAQAPSAPLSADATTFSTPAPQAYSALPQQPVAPASGGLLSRLWNGIKSFFSRLFAPKAQPAPQTPAATPTQPVAPAPAATESDAQIAARYGLLNSPANVAAFKATLASQQSEPEILGPGAQNAEAVAELQQLLAGWGYAVPATGRFDQPTADALVAWKTKQGLTESFVFANGQPGVTPFVDARTRQQMIAVLSGAQVQSTPAPVTPAPVTPAPVTPAPVTTAPAPVPPAPVTPTPVTTTPAPVGTLPTTTPTPAGVTAEEAAIAQQAGILPTSANVQAFLAVANALELESDVIGPDSNLPDAVGELQQLLTMWGYPVGPAGQFDATTQASVLKFKRDNGLTEPYQMADGSPGVHPFIDARTKAAMVAKLGG